MKEIQFNQLPIEVVNYLSENGYKVASKIEDGSVLKQLKILFNPGTKEVAENFASAEFKFRFGRKNIYHTTPAGYEYKWEEGIINEQYQEDSKDYPVSNIGCYQYWILVE